LRARVRLRHTPIEQHSECQQRIQAVLYHHGCPAWEDRRLTRGARIRYSTARRPLSVPDALAA
jgi:hypothetical protein